MISVEWAIAIFIAGGCIGIFLAAMCNMSAKADEDEERWRKNNL